MPRIRSRHFWEVDQSTGRKPGDMAAGLRRAALIRTQHCHRNALGSLFRGEGRSLTVAVLIRDAELRTAIPLGVRSVATPSLRTFRAG